MSLCILVGVCVCERECSASVRVCVSLCCVVCLGVRESVVCVFVFVFV